MTDHALDTNDALDEAAAPDSGSHAHVPESPWVVFPGLILLLIMPFGILFHPEWLAYLAEFATFTMFCVIFRLLRL